MFWFLSWSVFLCIKWISTASVMWLHHSSWKVFGYWRWIKCNEVIDSNLVARKYPQNNLFFTKYCNTCRQDIKLSNSLIKWWKYYISTNFNAKSLLKILKKLRIQLGFEPRTFWLLVRHSYHWATGPLVAEECRINVNILRIEFNPDNDLATQARHIQHAMLHSTPPYVQSILCMGKSITEGQ